MMQFLTYFLLAYGISFAFVESNGPFDIFDKIRDFFGNIHGTFANLFDCMFCFPTWVGFCLSIINITLFPTVAFTPFMLWFDLPWYITIIGDMFTTASGVYILYTVVDSFVKEN